MKLAKNDILKIVFKFMILLIFIAILLISFFQAGIFLVKKDTLHHANIMVILMGSIDDRVLEADDLFNEGLSDTFVMVNDNAFGSESLRKRGADIPNLTGISKKALNELGVPDSSILILPGRANSTQDEAVHVAAFLVKHPTIHSLILVSSAPHLRRASMIFNNEFRKKNLSIDLLCAPSSYTNFHAKHWWKYRESTKELILEYLKIVSFLLFEKWF